MQNNLIELYAMLEFVMSGLVRKVLVLSNRSNITLKRLFATNAPRSKRRAWLLFDLLREHRLLSRRDSRILDSQLPPKTHIVFRIRMSALQKRLYDAFMADPNNVRYCLDVFAVTSMISDHPVWKSCVCTPHLPTR
jgi:SNF2 family DNA or RNA helicase